MNLVIMVVLSDALAATIIAILGLIGAVVPPILAFFNRPTMSPRTKSILAIVASIVSGLVAYVATNGLHLTNAIEILGWILGAFTAITAAYHGAYKPLGLTDKIEAGVNNPAKDPGPVG